MPKMSVLERYLSCVQGGVSEELLHYIEPELARRRLQEMSGEDFGYDAAAWREWFDAHPEIRRMHDLT